MKAVSNNYKTNIKEFGKEIDSKITYTENSNVVELGTEELNSITPHFEGAILKSVMKQLDIDSNVEIPIGTIVNYQFGVLVNDNPVTYEYVNLGNYVVNEVEKQEDLNSYKIICYDKMLYSMVDYEALNITYPITIRNYINAICTHLGLTFKNANSTFANYNREIPSERYLDADGNSLNYTFRDVLDELAQVTASTICINEVDDELEIRYLNTTGETIDEDTLQDINVNFNQKYGPVNSIVLSRADGSDNVYTQDQQSITQNGLCEIKIEDNQIMNGDDREDYLPDLLTTLDGLEYYINDFSSTGITYLELCDKYNVSITKEDDEGNTTTTIYPCILLNDEINVTQGLQETIHTDMPDESVTEYEYASYTDKALKKAFIKVDKQNAKISLEVSQKLDEEEFTGANIILEINNDQGVAEINADKISLNGKDIDLTTDGITITSDNFQLDSEGNMTCKDGTFTGGNITLQDDGSEENASLKIQTITTGARSYAVGDDLSSEYIKIIVNKDSTLPKPNELAHYWTGQDEYNKYSTLIESNNYRIILHAYRITQQDGRYADFYNFDLRDKNSSNYVSLWTLTISYNADDTIRARRENRYYEEYQLPDDFGQLTAINPDNIVSSANLLANYFILVDYINREFTYSGHGIASDIFLAELYTAQDLTRITGIVNGTITPTSEDYERYDFDGDGQITSNDRYYVWLLATNYTYDDTDVERVYNIIMGTITPTQSDYDKYDINGDGQIRAIDYTQIRYMIKYIQPIIQNDTKFEVNTKRLENNIAFSQNGTIKTSMDVNGFHQDGHNLYADLYYQPGDRIQIENYITGGYVTGSTKVVFFSIITPKSLANITTATLDNNTIMFARTCAGGYLNSNANGLTPSTSGLTWTTSIESDNCITIRIEKTSAFTNVSNNQPLGIQLYPIYIDLD